MTMPASARAPERAGRMTKGLVAALTACALLAGCGGAPPPVPPTLVNATVSATADANAGPDGVGAPVAIRVYQLVSPAGFAGAQFFPVFNTDIAVLKDDIVKRDDLLVAPGQSKTLELKPEDRAHAIGVFAAYRDYEHVAWHAVVDIPAHRTSTLSVTAGSSGLTLKIEAAKPAK